MGIQWKNVRIYQVNKSSLLEIISLEYSIEQKISSINKHKEEEQNEELDSRGSYLNFESYKNIVLAGIDELECIPNITFNKDSYYIEYKTKAQKVLQILNGFKSIQDKLHENPNFPQEYIVLENAFNLLLDLFKVNLTCCLSNNIGRKYY